MNNPSAVAAHEVTVRSMPATTIAFVPGSAQLDGRPLTGFEDNPFDHGLAHMGFNLGTVESGGTRSVSYLVEAGSDLLGGQ